MNYLAKNKNIESTFNINKMDQILEIDGSVLEGGGQILRMSVAFSAIMGKPVRVTKIRAGRSKPGLAAQHLTGLQLVTKMCQGKLKGGEIGSTQIEFWPGKLKGGHYFADTCTAGSISLLLQIALPCALLADSTVILDLKGGTNADMAPQIDYMTEVYRPVLENFGATFDFDLHRRGYFPKGGGHATVTVKPVLQFRRVALTELGNIKCIYGWSFVAGNLPIRVADRMREGATQELISKLSQSKTQTTNIECYKELREMAPDNCNGIILVCETSEGCILGGDALGKRDMDPLDVGRAAATQLLAALNCGACLDNYAQDQVIILMALATGRSVVRVGEVTLHTKTAIHIAETVAQVKFIITPSGENNIIECTGLGFVNANAPR